MWIDTQGHEARVLGGATRLLERAPPVVLEYSPSHLAKAGGQGLEQLVAPHYTHFVDLRSVPVHASWRRARRPVSELSRPQGWMKDGAGERQITDVLLVHAPARRWLRRRAA